MQTSKIVFSAIAGTSAMTIFSYLVSESENENFREPEILGQLINRLSKTTSKDSAQIAGWLMHYAVGFIFVLLYNEFWKQKKVNPVLTSGAMLGAASGIAGITGWKIALKAHPNPPDKNLNFF